MNLAELQKKNANISNTVFLESRETSQKVACTLTQPKELAPEFEGSAKLVEKSNLRSLQCEPVSELIPDTLFDLVIDPSLSSGLKSQVRNRSYRTPPVFVIRDFVLKSATEACVYSTTEMLYSGSGIVFSPRAIIRSVGMNQYGDDGKYICEDRSPLIAHLAAVRLDGNTNYDLNIAAGLNNVYGMPLASTFVKKGIKTPALKKQDEYLYFIPSKEYQVIPMDAPIILPIQTINLATVNVRVCSMDPSQYQKYTANRYTPGYTPTCSSELTKQVPLKNGKWNLTTQKIDLGSDVFGGAPLPGNILLIQASPDSSWTHNYPEQRDFSVVYIRTNLSLTLETASNKSILFATDLAGKLPTSELQFETYGCTTQITPKYNAIQRYYESNTGFCDLNNGVIVAKNATSFGLISLATDATSNYDFGQMGGMDSMDREYTYLHTDRPIYRAGDTVHFQGILRSFATTGYITSKAKKVKLRILTNEGELFKEVTTPVDTKSNFNGSVDLTLGMRTGRYSFEVLAYNDLAADGTSGYYVVNDANFFVEQYTKPVFKTEVTSGKRDVIP